ncbi:hypothetical protein NDU88_000505 [Pleurodeles waltl]|uniref:Uncharacterized protein n=1 Tax=Pleurodeles waltl TaxID=8319 RepID=A0AAV7P560_PLEWA|nr:hypothetical protein NDU88_000505 [Pleurodeles waltl]
MQHLQRNGEKREERVISEKRRSLGRSRAEQRRSGRNDRIRTCPSRRRQETVYSPVQPPLRVPLPVSVLVSLTGLGWSRMRGWSKSVLSQCYPLACGGWGCGSSSNNTQRGTWCVPRFALRFDGVQRNAELKEKLREEVNPPAHMSIFACLPHTLL